MVQGVILIFMTITVDFIPQEKGQQSTNRILLTNYVGQLRIITKILQIIWQKETAECDIF